MTCFNHNRTHGNYGRKKTWLTNKRIWRYVLQRWNYPGNLDHPMCS